MNNKLVEMHAFIYGRVQRVGFRAATCHFAHQLGLLGSVRNCSDGSVELYVQGKESQLVHLLELIKKEFTIENIIADYHPPQQIFSDFSIV